MGKFSWTDAAHYGSALLLIAVGGATEAGLALPGVTVSDPKAVLITGLGILVAGLKGGVLSGGAK